MSPSILLADDHLGFREGLRTYLERKGLTVVGQAVDGAEALQLAGSLRPDIAVLDVAMPVLDGIEAALQMRAVSPATKVILLTLLSEDEYVRKAARAGAVGYVLKTRAVAELVEAIRQVHAGGVYVSAGISLAAFLEPGPGDSVD